MHIQTIGVLQTRATGFGVNIRIVKSAQEMSEAIKGGEFNCR